jgi:tetraacyldisaccharide-1-P 4'-kinase
MTGETLERIHQDAAETEASVFLTTQKDFARLARADFALPVWQLAIEIDLFDTQQALLERLLAAAEGRTAGQRGE